MRALLWLLVALPAVVGAGLCLAGLARPGRRTDAIAAVLAPITGAVIVALAVPVALTRPRAGYSFVAGGDIELAVDGLSALMLLAVAPVTALVLVFARSEGGPARVGQARLAGLLLLFAAAVLLTATASTLPGLLIGWEAMGATSFALIGFRWREGQRVRAGTVAFLTTRAGDLGLYAAAAAGLAGGAGLAMADLPGAEGAWRHVAAAGVLLAALGKAAQLPFSFWLSAAMHGPSAVSALLHSAAMVAMGGYLLLRAAPLLDATGWAAAAAAWVGAATAVVLGLVALAQGDLKQLLAASTAAQLGFVVLAAGLGAVAGGATQLVAHAATKALLFLAAGAWLAALGTKALPGLVGAGRRWPVVGTCAAVGALALAGLAPLSLWATKDEVLAAARASSPALYAVGLLGAALSAAYSAKIVAVVLARPDSAAAEHWDTEHTGTRRIGASAQVPLPILAAGAAVLGMLALPPAAEAVHREFDLSAPHTASAWEWAMSATLAALVFAAATWRQTLNAAAAAPSHGPDRWARRAARNWFGLEAMAHAVAVRPTVAAGGWLARFDDRVLDRGVEALAAGAGRTARSLAGFDDRGLDRLVGAGNRAGTRTARAVAAFDERGLDALVRGLVAGLRGLGESVRATQGGSVHRYYLALVLVLGAVATLLWAVN